MIVHLMFLLLRVSWLSMIMSMVARFEKPAADTTAGFIKGRRGVRQALYLARDELASVKEDKWVCAVKLVAF